MPLPKARLEDVRRGFEALAARKDGTPASHATVMAQTAMIKSLLSFGARVRYLPPTSASCSSSRPCRPTARGASSASPTRSCCCAPPTAIATPCCSRSATTEACASPSSCSLTWSHLLDREDGKMQIAGLVGKGGKEREVLLPADLANRLRAFRDGAGDDEAVFKGRPSMQRTLKDRPEGAMSARAVAQVIKRTAAARGAARKACRSGSRRTGSGTRTPRMRSTTRRRSHSCSRRWGTARSRRPRSTRTPSREIPRRSI